MALSPSDTQPIGTWRCHASSRRRGTRRCPPSRSSRVSGNRQVMPPAYGFQTSLFEPDFQMTEQIGWGLNDRDFLQQMVPRLERLSPPFAAWLITLSLHHPFDDFPDPHKA